MEETLTINGKKYSLVRTRQGIPVSVYKGENSYLRIGPKKCIQKELLYQKELVLFGFPVAEILEEGEYQNLTYFVETSLGEEHFGQIFKSHVDTGTFVSDVDFTRFFVLVKKYTEAQSKSVSKEKFDAGVFGHFVHYDEILKEWPELKEKSIQVMRKIEEKISSLPLVLSHGDFNPHNMFEKGIIDWERVSYAPFGYDLVVAVSQAYLFPHKGDFEFIGTYGYSKEQIRKYFEALDIFCEEKCFPKISAFKNEFIVCRNMWSLARMEKFPKIQKWRREQYEGILDAYLKGEDLMEYLLKHSLLYGT